MARKAKRASAEPCRHPVTRMIGDRCALCGAQVKAKARR